MTGLSPMEGISLGLSYAVAFPLRLIGLPLIVAGAYTSIRTTYPGWTGWSWPEFAEDLPVFTLSVSYEGEIF
jgi:hypothetical protein